MPLTGYLYNMIENSLTYNNFRIPSWPLHDSIIFRAKDKDSAILAMRESFEKVTGFKANIKCSDSEIKHVYFGDNFRLI